MNIVKTRPTQFSVSSRKQNTHRKYQFNFTTVTQSQQLKGKLTSGTGKEEVRGAVISNVATTITVQHLIAVFDVIGWGLRAAFFKINYLFKAVILDQKLCTFLSISI